MQGVLSCLANFAVLQMAYLMPLRRNLPATVSRHIHGAFRGVADQSQTNER